MDKPSQALHIDLALELIPFLRSQYRPGSLETDVVLDTTQAQHASSTLRVSEAVADSTFKMYFEYFRSSGFLGP